MNKLKKLIENSSGVVQKTLEGILNILKDIEKIYQVVHIIPTEPSGKIEDIHKKLDIIYGDGWRNNYFYFLLFIDGDRINDKIPIHVYFSPGDSKYIAKSFDHNLSWQYYWNGECICVNYEKDPNPTLEYEITGNKMRDEFANFMIDELKYFSLNFCEKIRTKYDEGVFRIVLYNVYDKEESEIKFSEYIKDLFGSGFEIKH